MKVIVGSLPLPRKKKIKGHQTFRDNAFELTKESFPRCTAVKVLRTQVVLNYGVEKSGLNITEFGRRYIETDSSIDGSVDSSNLVFKWMAGQNAATRKKFEKAGAEISGLLDLFDWRGFELLENEPISLDSIAEILKPFETGDPLMPWRPLGALNLDPRTATWMPGPIRHNTERLVHWKNLDGFLILLGLVREFEMRDKVQEHINSVFDLYRALPTVASMPGFRQCKPLLYYVVERIHLRCRLSRMMTHVVWDAIDEMASKETQDCMPTALESELFWRYLKEAGFDVVDYVELAPQVQRSNPIDPAEPNDFYFRAHYLNGKRTKTFNKIASVEEHIKQYLISSRK